MWNSPSETECTGDVGSRFLLFSAGFFPGVFLETRFGQAAAVSEEGLWYNAFHGEWRSIAPRVSLHYVS
jgi:hypothetical protein